MAHNLSEHTDSAGNRVASFYSLRVNPWHKLGTVVERPLSDPDALAAAGLNWTADKVPLRLADDLAPVPNHFAVVRSDDRATLGVVGDKYTPLQNRDLFAFFRDVAGVRDMTIETAGALGCGETVWVMARIPGLTLAAGDDISQGYLFIRNSHDGNACLDVSPTLTRVVCANTMAMATAETATRRGKYGRNTLSGGWRIRHTSGVVQAVADIADAYARTLADYATTRAAFSALTSKPLSDVAFQAMMAAAFKATAAQAESDRSKAMAKARADKIQAILASPTCRVSGTTGTLWAGLNAITEYVDHESRTRQTDPGTSDAAQRFAAAMFDGTGARVKALAWDAALSLV